MDRSASNGGLVVDFVLTLNSDSHSIRTLAANKLIDAATDHLLNNQSVFTGLNIQQCYFPQGH